MTYLTIVVTVVCFAGIEVRSDRILTNIRSHEFLVPRWLRKWMFHLVGVEELTYLGNHHGVPHHSTNQEMFGSV